MIYIATFYSHFGAIRFKKLCESKGWKAKIMPVPRDLSSSCGTCVRFESAVSLSSENISDSISEEVEQIVHMENGNYQLLFRAQDS